MNNKLKKDTEKRVGYAYQKLYMKDHTKVCITLDNKEDADIISWVKKQTNRSKAIRDLIRKALA